MKSRTLQAVLIPAASLLAGCVETVNIDEGSSLVLDATRRVVLVKSNLDGVRDVRMAEADAPAEPTSALELSVAGRAQALVGGGPQFEPVGSHAQRLVCAEPSPDALSALAASGEVSIGINGQGGSGGGGVNEAAAIAARTGAMQILRDLGYRACEGLMNGVIGASGYNRIIGGTASTVLGLVAVEGLTGGRFAETTTISAEAPAITPDAGFGQDGSAAGGAG